MSVFQLYVLHLSDHKFYVGRCQLGGFEQRLQQHREGAGSEWTSTYSVQSVVHTWISTDPLEEDLMTERLMLQYGIDSVRGGMYNEANLDARVKSFLQEKLAHAQVYPARIVSLQSARRPHLPSLSAERCLVNTPESINSLLEQNICFKCKQPGHYARDCRAERVAEPPELRCFACNETGHRVQDCPKAGTDEDLRKCHKCGLGGHFAANCPHQHRPVGNYAI